MKPLRCFLAVLLLSVLAAPFGVADDVKASDRKAPIHDIVAELSKKGFNTLLAAIVKTDLVEKLGTGSYTFLAPTDNAFRDIPKAQLDLLLAEKEKLTAVLSNHIIDGKLSVAELKSANPKSLSGTELDVKSVDGKLKVNAANVVKPDLAATNGIIHGIDKVFLR